LLLKDACLFARFWRSRKNLQFPFRAVRFILIGMKPLLLAALLALPVFTADDDGFVPLFNGRDLSGWVNANCAPETWSVTNGTIHCTGRPTGAMRTERQYENFIMEAEWRHLTSGGNSGVFIWGTPIAAPGVPFLRGIEVQVLDHGFNIKGKNEWYTTHGDVFPIHGATMKPFGRHNGERSFPSEERSKPSPEWNHYRIVCTNGTLRLSVNGKEVSGGENCNYRKGYLALESEGAPVEFRNVRIKELPSSNTPAELTAPKDEGFRTIFTGLDLRGWKAAPGWKVEGERLRFAPQTGEGDSTLRTEKEYGDVEFIFDVRGTKESPQPITVELRGVKIPIELGASGGFTRFQVSVKGGEVTVQRNGQESSKQTPAKSMLARGAFGLSAKTGVELMNLYARELR
jgi:hypothetical protein